MTPQTQKPPLVDLQSPSENTTDMNHLEGPLLTVMPDKPLVEMSDEELSVWHSRHRTHRLSMQALSEHLAARSQKKESVTAQKQNELKEKYQ